MGGTDSNNSTSRILQALKSVPLPNDCRITVIMGASAPWIHEVMASAKSMPWDTEVKINATNMAELMANSDLSIGAAGSTSWERCVLGLPSLVVILAENQKGVAQNLVELNAVIMLELNDELEYTLSNAVEAVSDERILKEMSASSSQVTSGLGRFYVSNCFYRSNIRRMQVNDLATVRTWRNHPKIRTVMHSQHEISMLEHQNWFDCVSLDDKKHVLIFECNDEAIGYINFTETSDSGEADWGFYVSPYAPKGTGLRLGNAALRYATDVLKLKKIRGEVLLTNITSQTFHKRLGFTLESSIMADTIIFTLTTQKYEQLSHF